MKAGDRADEIAELIATHELQALRYFDELGDTSPQRTQVETSALRWTRTAGDRANALGLRSQACRWYREALRLAEVRGRRRRRSQVAIARPLAEASFGTESVEDTEQACRTGPRALRGGWATNGAPAGRKPSLVMTLFNGGHADGGRGDGRARPRAARTPR